MSPTVRMVVDAGPHDRPGVVEQRIRGEVNGQPYARNLRYHWTGALDQAARLGVAARAAAAIARVPPGQVDAAVDEAVARIRGADPGDPL